MSPGDLENALQGLAFPSDENVLVGLSTCDDAGVYRIADDLALIQTVDFFSPVVDDPYDFGRIAAANALSDVYAMGGAPKTALNIVAFPVERIPTAFLKAILAGGADKLREAGAVLLGGHSVEDAELKYGLAVTGFIHPARILANRGLNPGDALILTKPLGTGIVSTAIKAGLAEQVTIRRVTEVMAALNRPAADIMREFHVSACTDITGFGLIGHLAEMIVGTGRGIVLAADAIPILPEAYEFASIGLVPAGAHNNRAFRGKMVDGSLDPVLRDILFDPQTSGGLLIGCPEAEARQLLTRLVDKGVEGVGIIGQVTGDNEEKIKITGTR